MKSLIGVKDILQKLSYAKQSYLNALQTLKISTHSIESKVCQLIKEIWQENTQFNIQEEKALFDQFSRYISFKGHLAKIDNLLLQNQLNNISYLFSFLKDMDKKIVQCRILIKQKNIQSTKMYHNIINNHQYNQGLIFDCLFSRKDLRLNPYIIEPFLAPILSPSCKETIYIEKNTNLRICNARELLLLLLKDTILPKTILNQASKNII